MAILSEEEIVMAKEECCRLGECTATYYLVNFIEEIEAARSEKQKAKVVRLGRGEIVSNYGTYNGSPAVFLEPADTPGKVGENAQGYEKNELRAGSVVIVLDDLSGADVLMEDLNSARETFNKA